METTYKLIKTYPRSPKIGTISTTAEWEDASKYPEFWQPVKEKFFTTQDGVDIFEGNTYWTVNTEQFSILKRTEVMSGEDNNDTKFINFSTAQKAVDYISMNIPQLSLQDVINATPSSYNAGQRHKFATQKTNLLILINERNKTN